MAWRACLSFAGSVGADPLSDEGLSKSRKSWSRVERQRVLQAGLEEFDPFGKFGERIRFRRVEGLCQDRFGRAINLRRISKIMPANPLEPLQGTSGIGADLANGRPGGGIVFPIVEVLLGPPRQQARTPKNTPAESIQFPGRDSTAADGACRPSDHAQPN